MQHSRECTVYQPGILHTILLPFTVKKQTFGLVCHLWKFNINPPRDRSIFKWQMPFGNFQNQGPNWWETIQEDLSAVKRQRGDPQLHFKPLWWNSPKNQLKTKRKENSLVLLFWITTYSDLKKKSTLENTSMGVDLLIKSKSSMSGNIEHTINYIYMHWPDYHTHKVKKYSILCTF